jgi:hypothetical protein
MKQLDCRDVLIEPGDYPLPLAVGQEIVRDGNVVAVVKTSFVCDSEAALLAYVAGQELAPTLNAPPTR